ATKLPAIVSAFDSGNLKPVAKALRDKFPNTPIIVASDDDKHLELTKGINPGKEKGSEAANSVNGFMILPTFAPGEQLSNPRQFSDFNDLANKSQLGIAGVKRQLKSKIDSVAKQNSRLQLTQKSNVVRIT
ncbi:TPA: DNA primase, partial [Legionella pneumophila]|nr:DNA primase [Legionella pneumophila]